MIRSWLLNLVSLALLLPLGAQGQEASPQDSLQVQPQRERAAPVVFSARDSLVLRFHTNGDTLLLHGEASIRNDEIQLTAAWIELWSAQNTLFARGVDTDSGRVGSPVFERGTERFSASTLWFNRETETGRFLEAQTQMEDGFIRARGAAVRADSTVFLTGGVYTTCPCTIDPSYSLRTERMKVQDRWVYTGPIQLYLFQIPTPLWLPFGVLPNIEGRRAGPLAPSWGEDDRGFYLRDLGWYWPVNDYFDATLRASLWTSLSYELRPSFRYAKRYAWNGNLDFTLGSDRRGEPTDPDFTRIRRLGLLWNHRQEINPRTQFNANVNLATTSYLRTSSAQFNDRVTQTIGSNITYSTRWDRSGRSLSAVLRQQQNLTTGSVSLTAPSLSFSQRERSLFPSRGIRAGGQQAWYQTITYGYQGSLQNAFTFQPLANASEDISWTDALLSPSKYRRATGQSVPFRFRAEHVVPIRANFQIRRLPLSRQPAQINIVPSASYRERWYGDTERQFIDSTGVLRRVTLPGFFALRTFDVSLSANTTLYGLFPLKVGVYDGLRHTVRPSLSLQFQPDYSGSFWGYTRTYTAQDGREIPYGIVPDVRPGQTQALAFNLGNIFETRRVEADTLGQVRRTSITLLNVDASTAYNFAADSLRLSDIRLSARTQLFGQVDVNASIGISPYQTTSTGQTVNQWAMDLSRGVLGRLTSASINAGANFSGQPTGPPRLNQVAQFSPMAGMPGAPLAAQPFVGAPYADFSLPWSLRLDATYAYSAFGVTRQRTITLGSSFDFNLTPRWKVNGQTGYDVRVRDFTTSRIALLRDFDCWDLSFSWVPFGIYQSYSFTLQVKSGKLREFLRLEQPRRDARNRFSQFI